jgi:Tfp pilus assembly protein PilP
MLRKVLVIFAAVAISVLCLSGCKKSSSEAESGEEDLKTMAEYESDAKKQITEKNVDEELERIEKSLEEEISQGQ